MFLDRDSVNVDCWFARLVVLDHVRPCFTESAQHCLHGDEEQPRAFVRKKIRIIVVVRRCLIDQVEVCRECPSLFSLPFFLAYTQDVLLRI